MTYNKAVLGAVENEHASLYHQHHVHHADTALLNKFHNCAETVQFLVLPYSPVYEQIQALLSCILVCKPLMLSLLTTLPPSVRLTAFAA